MLIGCCVGAVGRSDALVNRPCPHRLSLEAPIVEIPFWQWLNRRK